MIINKFRVQLCVIIILLFNLGYCNRRPKKWKKYEQFRTTKFDIFKGTIVPSDVQITTFLYKGEPKRLYYLSPVINVPLSVTIMTCSSTIEWTLQQNNFSAEYIASTNNHDQEFNISKKLSTSDISTERFLSKNGTYTIDLLANNAATYVHIYISTEKGGSLALRNANKQKLELLRRQKRGSLSVKWEPSLVDPQGTDYCIVVSQKKIYETLCSAETEIYGVSLPSSRTQQLTSSSQTIIAWRPNVPNTENEIYPLISCVGSRTHYTAVNLKHNQSYYFTVFAIDRQTNLTYAHVSSMATFDKNLRPIPLKNGKSTFANLKKLDGIALFRFKAEKKSASALNIFVMPCGKAVYVDITKGKIHLVSRKRIEKFDKIVIPNAARNAKYNIKVTAINTDEMDQSFGIEIFVTTKSSTKIPFPELPSQTSVIEYESLKRCDSVTIGWLPSPGQEKVTYCIVVQEKTIKEGDDSLYGMPNQCGLENRLRKSVNFALKYCKETRQHFQNVITEKINQLRPGQSYVIQVSVNKPNGKIFSYDLLQIQTSSSCHKHKTIFS